MAYTRDYARIVRSPALFCSTSSEKTTVYTKPASPPTKSKTMLKFTVGAILGWTAARTLDNKPPTPPTLEELLLLTAKGKAFYEKALKKIQDMDEPQ
jgi:hypothetical protein|tara:strand:+ start:139 stop:429 length:291 start_codon:yes stop_codon:yes gene_type:complete